MRQGGQPSRGRPAAGGPYHDRPGRRGLPPAATDTAARGARRGARNRNWPRSSTTSSPRRAGSRAEARRRALRGLSRLTRRPAMSVIPTLSSRRTGPGDGSHLLVRVPHTIVHDASRGTHNRSIGAADADLPAAARLATYSAFSAISRTRRHPAALTPLVAVGTALAGGPPRRSQRALLTHWAPASGAGVEPHAGPGGHDLGLG